MTRPRPENETEEIKMYSKPRHYKTILNGDPRIRLIKTADMLDNMRSWRHIPKNHPSKKKFHRWINETVNYYIPIAKSVNKNAAAEMKKLLKHTINETKI